MKRLLKYLPINPWIVAALFYLVHNIEIKSKWWRSCQALIWSAASDSTTTDDSDQLTTCVPDRVGLVLVAVLHALVHVWFGVAARHEDLSQQGDVRDGQPQCVDLRQPLLVGKRRYVTAQLLEGRVDAQHPFPLPDVSSVPLHLVRVVGHQPARPALVLIQRFIHRRGFPLTAVPRSRRLHVEVGEGQLCVREHGLTAERGPRRELACGRCVVQQEGVQLGLELEVLVHLSPEREICSPILVEIKKDVLHILQRRWAGRRV